MAKKFAEEENIKVFMESSAKSGFNAQKVFIESGKELYNNYQIYANRRGSQTSSTDSTPIETYNSRIRYPTQANVSGKTIEKDLQSFPGFQSLMKSRFKQFFAWPDAPFC